MTETTDRTMTREQLEDAVWEIVTYRSTDLGAEGTCGYLLTPLHVAAILRAADAYALSGDAAVIAERRRLAAEAAGDEPAGVA